MKYHLIHIGYPKTGSTSLQEWFRQHPQLFYAPGGLGGFYNVYGISQEAAQTAEKDFMYFVTSDESLSTPRTSTGDIPIEYGMRNFTSPDPSNAARKKVCEILKGLYPNGKILFITRGFKRLIMSSYSQYVRIGGVQTFHAFAAISRSAIKSQTAEKYDAEDLDFTFIANLYEEAFGRENMIILPFELLCDDQTKFLSIIEERLGLSHFEARIDRLNESLSPEELYWYPRISWKVSRVSRRFGQKVYSKIYRWYVSRTLENKFHRVIKLLSRLKPGRGIRSEDFPSEILDYFREHNTERFAAKFRDDPIYKPYLAEYLLDE